MLRGQVAWVVGGAGIVGAGIARGLIKAGATVIVNSRHERRLDRLRTELDNPEQLVTVNASMRPNQAAATMDTVMDMTARRLDHVVAHCGVNWWAGDEGDAESTTVRSSGSILHMPLADYGEMSTQLSQMHFAAAQLLMPLLGETGTYTFVTSNASDAWGPDSALAQLNTHGVIGLAATMRSEAEASKTMVRVGDFQLGDGLRMNRPRAEREASPRSSPLSHDIGEVVAGLVMRGEGGKVSAADLFELQMLKQKLARL